jgi:hypothetical protein
LNSRLEFFKFKLPHLDFYGCPIDSILGPENGIYHMLHKNGIFRVESIVFIIFEFQEVDKKLEISFNLKLNEEVRENLEVQSKYQNNASVLSEIAIFKICIYRKAHDASFH